MRKELKTGFLMMVALTVITGLVYPAVITVVAQVFFKDQANGSLVSANSQVVGSRLIGQAFTKPEYFHPRPSVAGANGYDATASAGSNLGPTNATLFNDLKTRVVHYCVENNIPFESSRPLDSFRDAGGHLDDVALVKAFNDEKSPLVFTPRTPLPADAVTTSASGLDPHISPRNAELQADRVARARGVSVGRVQTLIAQHTQPRTLGFLGEPAVNVLELNLALDARMPLH